jgi:signal transduction histidine kinase
MPGANKITPDVGWLLQRERLVAWLRVAFAALAILVVQLNPSRIALFPVLSLISLGLFFLYSLVILCLARQNKLLSKNTGLATSVLDVAGIALIVFSTGGTRTPFFFYYSFPVLTASLRWGIKGSIPVAFAGVAIYAMIRITLAAEAMAEPIGIDIIIVRSFYLILLACVFGFVCDFEKKQNQRLIALSRTATQAAAMQERRRIMYELHDGILQSLATLILRLESCRAGLPGPQGELSAEIASMEDLTRASMKQIREFLSGKETQPIVAGTLIERLRDEMKFFHSGLGLEVILESEPEDLDLPHNTEREVYYVIREGLTNVTRHSHASKVEIRLKQSADKFGGFLSDNGVGFDRTSGRNGYGVGLTAMEERIKKLGGELIINSTPGSGTNISFGIPLRERQPASDTVKQIAAS